MTENANTYRLKAAEMRLQAMRAETPFLSTIYQQMAEEWEALALSEAPEDPAAQVQKNPC